MVKNLLKLSAVAAFAFAFVAAPVASAAPTSTTLSCFAGVDDGVNGTCTLSGDAKSAVLNTVDGDDNIYNNYAGVYYETTSLSGKTIGQVDKLSFDYDGSGAVGGSPRFSVPIDEDGDGTYEGFAFIDTLGCNNGDANVGTLNVVTDMTCLVSYNGTTYDNWAAFVAAHPTYKIATDAIPFVIVDQEGEFTISNVMIGTQAAVMTKEDCKNGGWEDLTGHNGQEFKNQGQCVAFFSSNENSKHHRVMSSSELRF